MTSNTLFKPTALAMMLGALLTNTAIAEHHHTNILLKVPPSTIYQAAQGQSLASSLQQIAQRTGISFKVNTDISQDRVQHALAADNWEQAIGELLSGYNYSTIQDGEHISTVIVTGRNGNGTDSNHTQAATSAQPENLIVIAPKTTPLPSKYQNYPAGSVTAIQLPVNQLLALKRGAKTQLDLPMGLFNVAHDRTVDEADGSQTWVGHLDEEGDGYRLLVSQGNAGTMGVVTTPDGSYNIESDGKNTYLIDTSKLKDTGYEGDTLEPETLGNAVLNATQSELTQLQTAVDQAKKTLDTANAQVTQLNTQLNTYRTQLSNAQTALNNATTKANAAATAYNQAFARYIAKPSSAGITAINQAYAAYLTARTAYTNAANAYQTANNNVNSINTRLNAARTAVTTAQANYDKAVKALALAKATPTTPATPGTPPTTSGGTAVVDLMMIYTTQGQTADYAKQRINLLVTASNQAYIDSGINMKLRLVYTEPTTYGESNANATALSDLAYGRSVFSTIAQKRAQYGADLVFLFRPLYAKTQGSCGTTYVEFANGSQADKNYGYGTISDGNAKDSAGYYCAINTFTHEIGHSLGLVHDREHSTFPGVFNYAYAWGVQGNFGTIMSYKSPVIMYFSTPSLATQCKGQPCGYATTDTARSSDQAKSVNYTAPIVAGFMPTTTTTPVLK